MMDVVISLKSLCGIRQSHIRMMCFIAGRLP